MAASATARSHALKVHHSSGHCYGPNGELCVASDHKLYIYDLEGPKPVLTATLESHKHRVTGVDWSKSENKILSCGEDRNAYVWSLNEENEWKPTLVVLRVNRAALCCSWANCGKKFAVGTSARSIAICSYDEEHDFWVAKSIKKPKSAVTCLAWHKSDLLLAAGGTDFKCRVYNVFDPEVDKDAEGASDIYSDIKKFGVCLGEFSSLGYVNGCAFNDDGNQLVYTSQSAQTTLVTWTAPDTTETTTKQVSALPFNDVIMVKDLIIGSGHDGKCYKFQVDGTGFGDKEEVVRATKAAKKKTGTSAAFAKFHTLANTGGSKKAKGDSAPHMFAVSNIRKTEGGFSTCANGDKQVLTWVL